MDVKFEGQNVDRHLDMTLHNEQCLPDNTPPWPYLDEMSVEDAEKCKKDQEKEQAACGYDQEKKEYTKSADECCKDPKCQSARKCMLVPYNKGKSCCEGDSGHHLVED